MSHLIKNFLLFVLCSTLLVGTTTAYAGNETAHNGIVVDSPWSRPTPPVAVTGAAYVIMHNISSEQDRLIGARSEIADMVQIHDHVVENGLMKMLHLMDGIEIPEGEVVQFKPGGKHLMLMGLKEPLVAGKSFELILQFENAGEKPVTVKIREMEMSGEGSHDSHSGHGDRGSQSMEQGG